MREIQTGMQVYHKDQRLAAVSYLFGAPGGRVRGGYCWLRLGATIPVSIIQM
jgi:hypothetical protein